MNSSHSRIGQNRGCSTRCKPFVIANDNGENQEQEADISGCPLVLTTDAERTAYRRNEMLDFVFRGLVLY